MPHIAPIGNQDKDDRRTGTDCLGPAPPFDKLRVKKKTSFILSLSKDELVEA